MKTSAISILLFCFLISSVNLNALQGRKQKTTKLKLDKPTEIQDMLCRSYAVFHENGQVKETILAEEDTISGHFIPNRSRVYFRDDGTLEICSFTQDTEIGGYLCKGNRMYGYQAGFHPNGTLRLVWLAHDTDIQNILCMKASFWADVFGGGVGVYFHDNGVLTKCKLARDVTIEGKLFKKGDHVRFDRERNLIIN